MSEKASVEMWTCVGCGAPSPGRMRSCACATSVVMRGKESAWKIEPAPFPYPRGISRMADNEKALLLSFDSPPTDDEMRSIHEFLIAKHKQEID